MTPREFAEHVERESMRAGLIKFLVQTYIANPGTEHQFIACRGSEVDGPIFNAWERLRKMMEEDDAAALSELNRLARQHAIEQEPQS